MLEIVRGTFWFKVFPRAACIIALAWGSCAFADGSSRPYGGDGHIGAGEIIKKYNQTGELFRIEGSCQSSCTTLLAIRNVCVDRNATLLFHAPLSAREQNEKPAPWRLKLMLSAYNARLRNFLVANHYVDTFEFHAISGSELIAKFGYRPCP